VIDDRLCEKTIVLRHKTNRNDDDVRIGSSQKHTHKKSKSNTENSTITTLHNKFPQRTLLIYLCVNSLLHLGRLLLDRPMNLVKY
jgi:hypothetical protein